MYGFGIWKSILPPPLVENAEIVTLNRERWILEIYRTIISTLQGVAWVLLVFFVFALIAYVIVRIYEVRQKQGNVA